MGILEYSEVVTTHFRGHPMSQQWDHWLKYVPLFAHDKVPDQTISVPVICTLQEINNFH